MLLFYRKKTTYLYYIVNIESAMLLFVLGKCSSWAPKNLVLPLMYLHMYMYKQILIHLHT